MKYEAYPMQFEPILKENIWGGSKLKKVLGKPSTSNNVGESWELSTVPGWVSEVANGHYKSQSLQDLIDKFPVEILGESVFKQFGHQFPLLFKFIDAKEDLSIQVHPSDELAKKRHNSFGKTEMWYILEADPGANLIIGFKGNASAHQYLKHLENKTLPDILNQFPVLAGNAFYLETGTIHSIGAGVLLAEIQQTSDITYRIYDFDRVDSKGNKRELHIDMAIDAISYENNDAKRNYDKRANVPNPIVVSPYFTTNFIPLQGVMSGLSRRDSFTVYMCVEGQFEIQVGTSVYTYKKGDTILVPASLSDFVISGSASLLEIYIS